MNQPDVTLTDYGLALLCGFIVIRLWTGPGLGPLRRWLVLFFAGAGAAPLLGGTVHGFFDHPGTAAYEILWPATLIAVGLATLGVWGLGARLTFRDGVARGVIGLATMAFLSYAGLIVAGFQEFRVAVINYLPATLFLLLAVAISWRRKPGPGLARAALGLALTLVAAGGQQAGVSLHPRYFDHNALYHLVQAVALVLVWRGMVAYASARYPARVGRSSRKRARGSSRLSP